MTRLYKVPRKKGEDVYRELIISPQRCIDILSGRKSYIDALCWGQEEIYENMAAKKVITLSPVEGLPEWSVCVTRGPDFDRAEFLIKGVKSRGVQHRHKCPGCGSDDVSETKKVGKMKCWKCGDVFSSQ